MVVRWSAVVMDTAYPARTTFFLTLARFGKPNNGSFVARSLLRARKIDLTAAIVTSLSGMGLGSLQRAVVMSS